MLPRHLQKQPHGPDRPAPHTRPVGTYFAYCRSRRGSAAPSIHPGRTVKAARHSDDATLGSKSTCAVLRIAYHCAFSRGSSPHGSHQAERGGSNQGRKHNGSITDSDGCFDGWPCDSCSGRLCAAFDRQFGQRDRTRRRRMRAGLVARAGRPLPSDGERPCVPAGISPRARRRAVLAELS
jgi:hypothetical protein